MNIDGNDALNSNFEAIGFQSRYFVYNIGSMILTYIALPILSVITALLKACSKKHRCVAIVYNKIREQIYWNGTIKMLTETYVIVVMCVLINTTYVSSTPITHFSSRLDRQERFFLRF